MESGGVMKPDSSFLFETFELSVVQDVTYIAAKIQITRQNLFFIGK